MTSFSSMRRCVAVPLLCLLAIASVVISWSPALAIGSDPYCNPGNDCTGFEHAEYEVTEGSEYVEVTVFAAWCCPVGQGQIDYETSSRSAVAGQDFQHTAGTLTYAGGGWGAIYVPITDDTRLEGTEQFEVRLTNFRGTFVNRGHETAIVNILERPQERATSDPRPAAGASPQIRGSQTGSSPLSPRPSEARPASGSKATVPQPLSAAPPSTQVPALVAEEGVTEALDPSQRSEPLGGASDVASSDVEPRGNNRPAVALFAALAGLLLVTAIVRAAKPGRARPT